MPVSSFRVHISNLRCVDLPAPSAGKSTNAFVKLNFDNFKSHETKVKHKDPAPAWSDEVSFSYTTKFADCLGRKIFWLEVYDYNRFTANELIGVARVDLHTLATGPVAHRVPLRDGRKTRGYICFDLVMVQVSAVELRLSDVEVTGVVNPSAAAITGKLVLAPGAVCPKADFSAFSCPPGTLRPPPPDAMFLEGTLPQVLETKLEVTLARAAGGGEPLATGAIELKEAYSFVPGKQMPLTVHLTASATGKADIPTGTATLAGYISFEGLPIFCQMAGGIHIDSTIRDSEFPYPAIPMKPACEITRTTTGTGATAAAGGAGAAAGGDAVASTAALMSDPAIAAAVAAASAAGASTVVIVPAAASEVSEVPLMEPLFKPGERTFPAVSERLFAGAPGLPVCWIRRKSDKTGEVAYENLTYNRVEKELPVEVEYVVTVPPSATGPLGIALEPNFSGVERLGWRSGRRNSGYDLGAVVRSIREGSFAADYAPRLRPGHHLISINGTSTSRLTFEATVTLMKNAGRPLVLRFHDPYAVPAAIAAAVGNATEMVAGTYIGSKRTMEPVPPRPSSSSPLSSVATAMGANAMNKRTIAAAQKSLDLALDTLAKVDMHSPLIQAAQEAQTGAEPSQVTHDALAMHKALADPGFLRSINTIVTGTAKDLSVKKDAEGDEGAAGGDDDDEDDGSKPTEAPTTEDKAAERALKVMAVLTATDDAALSGDLKPAYMTGVRDKLKERATRMADLGMFRRTVDACNARNNPEFAKMSLKTVATIMKVYNMGAKDLGLDSGSAVGVSTMMRKDNFSPVMAESIAPIVSALADDNPDSDGLAFIQAVIRATDRLLAMTSAGYQRVFTLGSDGMPRYIYVNRATGTQEGTCPAVVLDAMNSLMDVDRKSRLLDDGAVVPGPDTMFLPIYNSIVSQLEDPFVTGVMVAAAGKLAAHPHNAALAVSYKLLDAATAAVARHEADARSAEGTAALFFNVGRDLDQSEALLEAGASGRCCQLARVWMAHKTNAGGTPCSWPPEGRAEECEEGVVFAGLEKYARDRNAVRARLVRTCINVLINLACFRTPLMNGDTSVALMVRHGGVALLGDIVRMHLSEPTVVTSVLNCAANIAFKNRDVQLALGERMMDAVVLAGYQFRSDTQLLSMALRTIGNLTNQDANIYRCLGYGAVRMIAAAMRENAANVPLQNLAASVLSNIASVEAVDDDTANEYMKLLVACRAARLSHPYAMLRPTPADAEVSGALLASGRPVWSAAAWLLLEEDAVGALNAAMTLHSTDVAVVEAVLRTMLCIASDEGVAQAMVERFDAVSKTLFVMRAADFDVGVQLAGATLLQILASNPATVSAVTGSDAALAMASAIDTHKASLLSGLNASINAVASLPGVPDLDSLLNALAAPLEGKPGITMQLLTRVYEAFQLLHSGRTAKAIADLNTCPVTLLILQTAVALLNTLARRGFNVALPPGADPVLQSILGLVHAGCVAVAVWAQGPTEAEQGPTEDLIALRTSIVANDRIHMALVRLAGMCVLGTGQPGDPSRPAVQLKVGRAVVDCLSSCVVTSPVLPGRSQPPGAYPAPNTKADGRAVQCMVAAGGIGALGGLLLAYTASAVEAAAVSPSPDVAQLTARMLCAQLLVLLDVLAAYTLPTVFGAAMSDPAALAADPLAMAVGMVSASANAFTAIVSHPGVAAVDNAPSPTRLMDLSDLARRIATHIGSRLSFADPTAALAGTGAGSSVSESEATAIFQFSISRARQMLANAPTYGAANASYAAPSGYARSHPSAAGGSGAPMMMMMAPAAPAADAGAASGGGAPVAAAGGSGASSSTPRSLRRMASSRGMLGAIATEEGVCVLAWVDGKSRPVVLKVVTDSTDIAVYDAKSAVKSSKKVEASFDPSMPMLSQFQATDYTAARVGPIMVGGKLKKQTGLFKSGPKPERSVCLDTRADTMLQFECNDAPQAEALRQAFEALANMA